MSKDKEFTKEDLLDEVRAIIKQGNHQLSAAASLVETFLEVDKKKNADFLNQLTSIHVAISDHERVNIPDDRKRQGRSKALSDLLELIQSTHFPSKVPYSKISLHLSNSPERNSKENDNTVSKPSGNGHVDTTTPTTNVPSNRIQEHLELEAKSSTPKENIEKNEDVQSSPGTSGQSNTTISETIDSPKKAEEHPETTHTRDEKPIRNLVFLVLFLVFIITIGIIIGNRFGNQDPIDDTLKNQITTFIQKDFNEASNSISLGESNFVETKKEMIALFQPGAVIENDLYPIIVEGLGKRYSKGIQQPSPTEYYNAMVGRAFSQNMSVSSIKKRGDNILVTVDRTIPGINDQAVMKKLSPLKFTIKQTNDNSFKIMKIELP